MSGRKCSLPSLPCSKPRCGYGIASPMAFLQIVQMKVNVIINLSDDLIIVQLGTKAEH